MALVLNLVMIQLGHQSVLPGLRFMRLATSLLAYAHCDNKKVFFVMVNSHNNFNIGRSNNKILQNRYSDITSI